MIYDKLAVSMLLFAPYRLAVQSQRTRPTLSVGAVGLEVMEESSRLVVSWNNY